ncbi:MAG: hypothetical protein PHY94_00440 [Candidatus Omnitrophica bacterium]|nr:hypothetical protein [Candidatus Omnitrophota bacterium]
MHKVGIFSFARKQSERCPNKMLRPFSNTTLTDIVLGKLAAFKEKAFFSGYEDEFKDKCIKAGVRFVKRSKKSATIDQPITEILSFLKKVDYEYLLIVSACLPFLKTETISAFLKDCISHQLRPAFTVVKRNNFYFTTKRNPLNFSPKLKTINTKVVKPVYEFAHALYFFNREYFFTKGRYWDWEEVRLFELADKMELLDIDTEQDFRIIEELWKNR